MFGANLSKVAQRKADKKNNTGLSGATPEASTKSPEGANLSEFSFLELKDDTQALSLELGDISIEDEGESHETMKTRKRLPEGALPIIYSEERQVPPELLLEFFKAGTKMLLMKTNIALIVDESAANNAPLYVQSMNFQKDVLERNFQIEREYGCKQLSMVTVNYPDNKELQEAASNFMSAAMESYLEQVKHRAGLRFKKIRESTGKDAVLRSAGGMSRQDFMEFFEVVCATVCLPQARATFKAEYDKSKKFENVAATSVRIQHRLLELIGVEWKYGVDCLNKIGQQYNNDRELTSKFMTFQVAVELYCRLACMSPEQESEFLEECPVNTKNIPHIYFARKQMSMMMQGGGGNAHTHAPKGPTVDPSKLPEDQRELFERLSSEEGTKRVTSLFQKVNSVKDSIMNDIEGMNENARKAYLEEFAKSSVAQSIGNIKAESAYEGLEAFTEMDEEDLKKVLTMNAVFNADTRAGGSMMKHMKDHAHVKGAMVQFSNTIRLLSTSMMQAQQHLAAQVQQQQQAGDMSRSPPSAPQDHHQHHHHHHHQHHQHQHVQTHGVAREAPKPDLASGDIMDR